MTSCARRYAELTNTVQEGIARNNGTQEQTFTAAPDQMWVMRTADGGRSGRGAVSIPYGTSGR